MLPLLLISLCASLVAADNLADHSIQYQRLNPSRGTYNYGYDTGLSGSHSFHQEKKDPVTGTVHGRYGYTDPNGNLRLTNYEAGPNGYNVVSSAQVSHAKPLVPVASGRSHTDYVAVSPHSGGVPARCARQPCTRHHDKVVQVTDEQIQDHGEKVSVSHSVSSKTHHVDVKSPIVQHVDQVKISAPVHVDQVQISAPAAIKSPVQHIDQVKVSSPVVHIDQVKVSPSVDHVDRVTVHSPPTTHHRDTIVAHKLPDAHHHPHDHPNYSEHGHHHLHHRYHDSHTTPGVSTHEHVSSSSAPVVISSERRSHEDVTHHQVTKVISDTGRVTPVHPVLHHSSPIKTHVDVVRTQEPIQVKTTHSIESVKVSAPIVKSTHVDVSSPVKHIDTVSVRKTPHSPIAVFRSRTESKVPEIQVTEPTHYTFAPNYKPASKYSRCYCV